MTSPEMDMATCNKKLINHFLHETKPRHLMRRMNNKYYQIETQTWMIHWKMTYRPVHRTKYAKRNMGNRCKENTQVKPGHNQKHC